MKHKLLFLALALMTVTGCADFSYIRSDVLLDQNKVGKIYMMPIIESVQIDRAYIQKEKDRKEIRSEIIESIGMLYDGVETNLIQKGYRIEIDRRRFADLDDGEKNKEMRDSILAAVQSVMYADLNIVLTDGEGNKQVLKAEGESGIKSSDRLIDKTINCVTQMKIDADTVMYFHVDTCIAQRWWWFWVREESYLTYKIDMVNVKESAVIFSFKRTYPKTDLLTKRKMLDALDDILTHIPLRM